MVKLRDLVGHFKNKINSQEKLEIRKLELKKYNIRVEDLLEIDIPLSKKIKRFEEI